MVELTRKWSQKDLRQNRSMFKVQNQCNHHNVNLVRGLFWEDASLGCLDVIISKRWTTWWGISLGRKLKSPQEKYRWNKQIYTFETRKIKANKDLIEGTCYMHGQPLFVLFNYGASNSFHLSKIILKIASLLILIPSCCIWRMLRWSCKIHLI